MPFQPFGYRFEVITQIPPERAKETIRSRKKRFFDMNNGARGWILGPFICLWHSALNKNGPMLVGRMAPNGFGTKISGRAGSDLNGTAMFALLVPLMAVILYLMIASGEASGRQILIIGAIILLSPLVFWISHQDRREAAPLVRFLEDAITVSGQSLRSKWAGRPIALPLTMTLNGEEETGKVTAVAIHNALLDATSGDSIVLGSAPEDYFQVLSTDGSFIIEKREGSRLSHFQAKRPNDASLSFTFEETLAGLMAYALKEQMPTVIRWIPMTGL